MCGVDSKINQSIRFFSKRSNDAQRITQYHVGWQGRQGLPSQCGPELSPEPEARDGEATASSKAGEQCCEPRGTAGAHQGSRETE